METLENNFQTKQPLPNATAVLVLGIISIVGCFCYGIVGLICGIIALILASKAKKIYEENPEKWSNYANLNAGRICAIIGTIISGLYMLFWIVYVLFFAAAMSAGIGEFPFDNF
ncbi:CCC motif membrane protein [Flavobacteriales bacterium]|nr:CCC motif membrane protein [Flavobacteriales bacterium]